MWTNRQLAIERVACQIALVTTTSVSPTINIPPNENWIAQIAYMKERRTYATIVALGKQSLYLAIAWPWRQQTYAYVSVLSRLRSQLGSSSPTKQLFPYSWRFPRRRGSRQQRSGRKLRQKLIPTNNYTHEALIILIWGDFFVRPR